MHLLGIGEKNMFAIKHVISVIFSLKTTSPILFTRNPPTNWIGIFLNYILQQNK